MAIGDASPRNALKKSTLLSRDYRLSYQFEVIPQDILDWILMEFDMHASEIRGRGYTIKRPCTKKNLRQKNRGTVPDSAT